MTPSKKSRTSYDHLVVKHVEDSSLRASDNLAANSSTAANEEHGQQEPISRTGFLALPMELRLMVYRLSLVAASDPSSSDHTIRQHDVCLSWNKTVVTSHGRVDGGSPHVLDLPKRVPDLDVDPLHSGFVTNINRYRAPNLNAALLRVCRQVYDEARSVLYAENIFHMNGGAALSTLASLQQRSRAQIRELHLYFDPQASRQLPRLMQFGLRNCWQLRSLTLHFSEVEGKGTPPQHLVDACKCLCFLPACCDVVLIGTVWLQFRESVASKFWQKKAAEATSKALDTSLEWYRCTRTAH